ncbi:MAG: DoxX family protein [Thermoanaerobaculia bacterium]
MPRIIDSNAPAAVILIRLMIGAVFVSEGIQKFLYPAELGSGRFERIGFGNPELTTLGVGAAEILFGALVLVGLYTRAAAVPLALIMIGAIVSTKIPILLGESYFGFQLRKLDHYGFWSMAHEARTDWAMLLGSLFLIAVGAGKWSLDARLASRRSYRR